MNEAKERLIVPLWIYESERLKRKAVKLSLEILERKERKNFTFVN